MGELVQCYYTFANAEAGEVSTIALLSNSEHTAEAIFEAAGREKQCAYGNSFAALGANMRLGGHLDELQKILPRGEFGREVKAHLGFERQWSARLMQLHEMWPHVLKAIDWAKSTNRLKRSELGVDRALALLAEWRREISNSDETADKNCSTGSNVTNKTISKKKLIEQIEQLKKLVMKLLHKLLEAQRYITLLESEIERLTGAAPQDARREDQIMLPLLSEAPTPDQLLLPFSEHMQ